MIYIYDIILNLNEEFLNFFEWEDTDDIKMVRKIPLIKTDEQTLLDFLNYKIEVSNNFLDLIKDKSLFYDELVTPINYITLLSDGTRVIAVSFEKNKTYLVSHILPDEEMDILKQTDTLEPLLINYQINEKRLFSFNTRYEVKIKKELIEELDFLYRNNYIDKLNYCYYEYFNHTCNDKTLVYDKLKSTIINDFNKKHITLHKLVKLSYSNKQNN